MYCIKCGTANLDTSVRCTQCGVSLVAEHRLSNEQRIDKLAAPMNGQMLSTALSLATAIIAWPIVDLIGDQFYLTDHDKFGYVLLIAAVVGGIVRITHFIRYR